MTQELIILTKCIKKFEEHFGRPATRDELALLRKAAAEYIARVSKELH